MNLSDEGWFALVWKSRCLGTDQHRAKHGHWHLATISTRYPQNKNKNGHFYSTYDSPYDPPGCVRKEK